METFSIIFGWGDTGSNRRLPKAGNENGIVTARVKQVHGSTLLPLPYRAG
jgi:hypothetical protein